MTTSSFLRSTDLGNAIHTEESATACPRRGVDHDLRNLVSLIWSVTHLMRAGPAGPLTRAQEEYLGDLLECARRVMRHLEPSVDTASQDRSASDRLSKGAA